MVSFNTVLASLQKLRNTKNVAGMAKFGMSPENRLGISIPNLRKIAKEIGKSHLLALELWRSGFAEARILASMVDRPDDVTDIQMEDWVSDFNSWDICDQVCMNLFDKTQFVWDKIILWVNRDEEYVKRAGFALIAILAVHDKHSDDARFKDLFSLIVQAASDDRNYVKKAVSWALRNIGKRNQNLNKEAMKVARQLQQSNSKTARWIGSDTIRDITSQPARRRLHSL